MPSPLDTLTAALADRYRLERELGQGGMATVYLAEDLKHHRKVAIKVLRPELAAVIGAERFLSEIKTTANLQHPHIVALYDSGTADSFLYYVMPYLEGESLRDRLSREKQLPIDDARRIASEVAGALDYAHRHGVIHRDIKPENILLHDGRALVADFGIALAALTAGPRLTETGLSLGTPAYMSPEQAVGERTLDARTDVYALGCVTYEMLTGEPPFDGPTAQAIIAKVMAATPVPPSTLRQRVPPEVETAVLAALEKLPADRTASAAKFAAGLERHGAMAPVIPASPQAGGKAVSRPSPRWVAAGLAVALLFTAAGWWLGRRSLAAPGLWTQFTQLTDAAGVETGPTLSPDGTSFAYASDARGSWDIYVQRVGGRNPVLVAGDSTLDEEWPAYSPDGASIVYNVRGGGIFVMGATGESARRLTTFGTNAAWSPDGRRIAFGSEPFESPYDVSASGTIWTVDAAGGEPRQLDSTASGGRYQPAWSPSGARIAFWTSANGQRDLVTIPGDGGRPVNVTNDVALDWAPTWAPDGGHIYFASDRGGAMGIWRIPVDETSGHATGPSEPVASGVDVAMDLPHLSRDGQSLLFRSKIEAVNPAAIAFDPVAGRAGEVRLLQHRTSILVPTDVSPDGRWLALYSAVSRQQDIFIMQSDGGGLTHLTDDNARDWFPRFTSDGEALVFHSNLGGSYEAWSIRLDGSGRTLLTNLSAPAVSPVLSADGQRLVVGTLPAGSLVGGPPWPMTEQTSRPLTGLEAEDGALAPNLGSPDGRWLSGAIFTPTGDFRGIGVHDRERGRTYKLTADAIDQYVDWLPDSRQVVYFTRRGTLVTQDILTLIRREVAVTLPYPPDQTGSIAVAPDGRTLYYGARQVEANVWLVRTPGR